MLYATVSIVDVVVIVATVATVLVSVTDTTEVTAYVVGRARQTIGAWKTWASSRPAGEAWTGGLRCTGCISYGYMLQHNTDEEVKR